MINNQQPIIYISGWMGGGKNSGTYRWLERYFTNIDAFAAGGCTDIGKLRNELADKISHLNSMPLIIGNSYGGYLASFFEYPAILVNPTLYASITLPMIADLSAEEIARLAEAERVRDENLDPKVKNGFYSVISTTDEIISDHKIEAISNNAAVLVPGGKHRLTDDQRTEFLLPLIHKVLEQDWARTNFF